MAQQLIAIVFPVLAIILLGFFYARRHGPEMAVANTLNPLLLAFVL